MIWYFEFWSPKALQILSLVWPMSTLRMMVLKVLLSFVHDFCRDNVQCRIILAQQIENILFVFLL